MDIIAFNTKYKLLRRIGSGGFGDVFLARNLADNIFCAVKIVKITGGISRELGALKKYKAIAEKLQGTNIVGIGDIAGADDKLCYSMPLADGVDMSISPEDESWRPKSLQTVIDERRNADKWFSRDEIAELFLPIITAADALGKAGMLHRDIKPQNILFFCGKPVLGDIGLLTEDRLSVSSAGTPYYSAPSWYSAKHGNPDMWGLAATFFTLLTGNSPDLVGRAAYLYPPQGKDGMSTIDILAWDGFIAVVNRAMEESVKERYLHLSDMSRDIQAIAASPTDFYASKASKEKKERPNHKRNIILLDKRFMFVFGVIASLLVACGLFFFSGDNTMKLSKKSYEEMLDIFFPETVPESEVFSKFNTAKKKMLKARFGDEADALGQLAQFTGSPHFAELAYKILEGYEKAQDEKNLAFAAKMFSMAIEMNKPEWVTSPSRVSFKGVDKLIALYSRIGDNETVNSIMKMLMDAKGQLEIDKNSVQDEGRLNMVIENEKILNSVLKGKSNLMK